MKSIEGIHSCYDVHMSTTLTVRTDESLREALQRRAEAQGKTVSALVREILEKALEERPIAERAGHLKACLNAELRDGDPWRRQIKERNWPS